MSRDPYRLAARICGVVVNHLYSRYGRPLPKFDAELCALSEKSKDGYKRRVDSLRRFRAPQSHIESFECGFYLAFELIYWIIYHWMKTSDGDTMLSSDYLTYAILKVRAGEIPRDLP